MPAIKSLEKTTNSLGKDANCVFINPKDREKNIVATIKFNIFEFYNKDKKSFNIYKKSIIVFISPKSRPF